MNDDFISIIEAALFFSLLLNRQVRMVQQKNKVFLCHLFDHKSLYEWWFLFVHKIVNKFILKKIFIQPGYQTDRRCQI